MSNDDIKDPGSPDDVTKSEAPSSGSSSPHSPSPQEVPTAPSGTSGTPAEQWADDDERWLWIDPLTDARTRSGAVLLDDVITTYVKRYNLLVERDGFDDGKLKGASYTMTPAENEGWTFISSPDGKGHKKVSLKTGTDHLGDFYWVPSNSLVYIKLKQKLRLPFYVIGRHNLKIRYVYKGLLLGTGPQVDPGFWGHLFIPLHNFTTSDVKVYFTGTESSFVSIDFVRTTLFVEKDDVSAKTRDELYGKLKEKGRALIDPKKVKQRNRIEDYLEGSEPRSQMAEFAFRFDQLEAPIKKELKKVNSIANGVRIAAILEVLVVAGLLFAALEFFLNNVNTVRSTTAELKAITSFTNAVALTEKVEQISRSQREAKAATAAFSTMSNEITALQVRIKQIEDQVRLGTNKVVKP